jgi:hypothetical protein
VLVDAYLEISTTEDLDPGQVFIRVENSNSARGSISFGLAEAIAALVDPMAQSPMRVSLDPFDMVLDEDAHTKESSVAPRFPPDLTLRVPLRLLLGVIAVPKKTLYNTLSWMVVVPKGACVHDMRMRCVVVPTKEKDACEFPWRMFRSFCMTPNIVLGVANDCGVVVLTEKSLGGVCMICVDTPDVYQIACGTVTASLHNVDGRHTIGLLRDTVPTWDELYSDRKAYKANDDDDWKIHTGCAGGTVVVVTILMYNQIKVCSGVMGFGVSYNSRITRDET